MYNIFIVVLLFAINTFKSHGYLDIKWPGWPGNYSTSPESYGIGELDDMVNWSRHPCKRECKEKAQPLTCRYGFTIESYATMSKACYDCPFNVTDCYRPHCLPGDGSKIRAITVANRMLPGPSIEVCKGDRIIVDVKNDLMTEETSLHWHGLHQRGTPFMDGVPMISQCPIEAGDTFRYDFKAENAGTFWWHAHSGMQRSDGLFGGLIVRTPASENRVDHLYDRDEHTIIINEWSNMTGIESYEMQYQTGVTTLPHTLFINGYGRYQSTHKNSTLIPRHVFHVVEGTRYRFRVINAGAHTCPMYITIDDHPLMVISADGADVEPLQVDMIRLMSGERYDFVLDANQQVGNYWIRVKGDVTCLPNEAHQEAILRYQGAPNVNPSQPVGWKLGFDNNKSLLNPFDRASETEGAMCVSCSLKSLDPDDITLLERADQQIYLNFDFYFHDNPKYHRKNLYGYHQIPEDPRAQETLQINHLSFKRPNFPLQTQPELIGPQHICNITAANCTQIQCSCSHVLQLKLNSTVEFILIDEGIRNTKPNLERFWMSHPMHLHGFYYRVLAMEKLNKTTSVEQVKSLDQAGKINRKLHKAPWKDVLGVPSGGYAVIRIRADNPGYWFFHCHFEKHAHNGMALVLKVGEHEDFPPVPKDFPKCFRHST